MNARSGTKESQAPGTLVSRKEGPVGDQLDPHAIGAPLRLAHVLYHVHVGTLLDLLAVGPVPQESHDASGIRARSRHTKPSRQPIDDDHVVARGLWIAPPFPRTAEGLKPVRRDQRNGEDDEHNSDGAQAKQMSAES